jgi:lipooligosaccharide transport system permease protein
VWEALRTAATTTAFLIVAVLLGGIGSWWALVTPLLAMLLVVAVAAPVSAWSTWTESDRSFPIIMRVGVLPMFLFSGTFFPTASLPAWAQRVVPLSPLYHGVELLRAATTGRNPGAARLAAHALVLGALTAGGAFAARRTFARRLSP